MKSTLKTIIFDMGGTLLDYDPVPEAEIRIIRNKLIRDFLAVKGYQFTPEQIDEHLLIPYYETDCRHAEKTCEEVRLVERIKKGISGLKVYEDYSLWIVKLLHKSLKDNLIVYEGSTNTLEKLSGKYELGLISNTTIPGVYFAGDLEELGMAKYFKHMLFTADTYYRKPHSLVFNLMLNFLKIKQPQEALYVGDSFKNDVYGPAALGMKTAWINPKNKPIPDEFKDVKPDLIINSVSDLCGILL